MMYVENVQSHKEASQHQILLVEDNPGDADLVREWLTEATNSVFYLRHVKSLAEASALLTSIPADAVILDLNLPDSRGIETLRRIRTVARGVPIIVVSGFMDEDLRNEAIRESADEVFTKEESNSPLLSRSVLYAIERIRARETHRQLEGLLDKIPDAILVVSDSGVVNYVNEAALALFGRDREDFIGQPLGFSIEQGEPLEIGISGEAGWRVCEMRVVQFEWQDKPALLASVRDLTELKNSQREAIEGKQLAQDRARLLDRMLGEITGLANRLGLPEVGNAPLEILNARADEPLTNELLAGMLVPFEAAFRGYIESNIKLAEHNRDLEDAKASVEAANLELEAFSYSVAHDLRAPLRAIDGFSLALAEESGGRLDDQCSHYLSAIRESVQRMGQLIEDLLELSRITMAEMRRSTVDITAVARTISSRLQESDSAREVEFVIQGELVAEADTKLVEIVLENLLSNAYKFSARQSKARIELGVIYEQNEDVFFVRDNGAGFNLEYAGKLFGVFQRLHSSSEFEGTGVGLTIVKRIVQRHGGRVWAAGSVGNGATFYFTLQSIS